jgi:EAL domain-containing protein (putative c-di-GMP-specific phosphodiesterase class I)
VRWYLAAGSAAVATVAFGPAWLQIPASLLIAVAGLTAAMGQRVVAEGVETPVQRDWLRGQGCELAQGWLYGRPQIAAELTGCVTAPR